MLPLLPVRLRQRTSDGALGRRCQRDDLIAAGANTNQRDWHTDPIFDESQVVDRQLGKILGATSADGRDAPTRERLVDRPHPRQPVRTRGNGAEEFTIDLIADANLDRLENVEDVEEGECDVGDTVQTRHIARRDRVEPPRSAWPSGRRAVLVPTVANQLPSRVL